MNANSLGCSLCISITACVLLSSTATAIDLTVREDSAVRLDITLDWSDEGDGGGRYVRGDLGPTTRILR